MNIQNCSQIGQADLAAILDFHSVGYIGHISCEIEKSEVVFTHATVGISFRILTLPHSQRSYLATFTAVRNAT